MVAVMALPRTRAATVSVFSRTNEQVDLGHTPGYVISNTDDLQAIVPDDAHTVVAAQSLDAEGDTPRGPKVDDDLGLSPRSRSIDACRA